ncbi:hypothetical protein D3C81_2065410 [compost metagenome]
MYVASELRIHLLHYIDQIAQYLQHVDLFRPQPRLGRLQVLTDLGHTAAQPLDLLLHVPAYRRVVLLSHHQV